MLLYHGSYMPVEIPSLEYSRNNTDFGRGFYTTVNFEQSVKWAAIKKMRERSECGYVSIYEIDESCLDSRDFMVYKFTVPDERWLEFVVANRRGANMLFRFYVFWKQGGYNAYSCSCGRLLQSPEV